MLISTITIRIVIKWINCKSEWGRSLSNSSLDLNNHWQKFLLSREPLSLSNLVLWTSHGAFQLWSENTPMTRSLVPPRTQRSGLTDCCMTLLSGTPAGGTVQVGSERWTEGTRTLTLSLLVRFAFSKFHWLFLFLWFMHVIYILYIFALLSLHISNLACISLVNQLSAVVPLCFLLEIWNIPTSLESFGGARPAGVTTTRLPAGSYSTGFHELIHPDPLFVGCSRSCGRARSQGHL